ncbi:hypothetical protein EDC01DRAFT_623604 [Geopyxis carbonaria]|nr:hypothetical protein EDC01DRAFT_623604 [Geopyxis carbonaria]
MGQGASLPRDEIRDLSRSADQASAQPPQDGERPDDAADAEDRATTAARLRRTRRLRNHFEHLTRLSNRFSSNNNSAAPSTESSQRTSRIPSLRFRTRSGRYGGSRSPSPLNGTARSDQQQQRRRTMPAISRPIPLDSTRSTQPNDISVGDSGADMMDISPVSTVVPPSHHHHHHHHNHNHQHHNSESAGTSGVRRSRISRVRDSISSWPDFMSNGLDSIITRPSSRRSHRNPLEALLHPGHSQMDIDNPSGANTNATQTDSTTAPAEAPPNRPERPSLFGPQLMDHLDNPARARPGEDQAAMLSRLLSVAAAATAASLVGNAEQAITEAQDVGGDNGGDGSFESFLRALQNGRLEAALRNGGNELGGGAPPDPAATESGMLSLNFFRMFRFGSHPTPEGESTEGENNGQTGRMVPVIIVGIRSVTPRESTDGEGIPRPTPFFDALANLPVTIPSIHRRSRLGTTHRRSQSTGGAGLDPLSTAPTAEPASAVPSAPSATDTPNGPYPPPSTPADPTLPNFPRDPLSSQANRRSTVEPDVAEEDESGNPSTRREGIRRRPARRLSNPEQPSSNNPFSFASRNSNARAPPANVEGTRSWIIYVLGGSYPENHPILTTPSLFTDEPTYEDMTLLSSLLGPAKPPVATSDDVEQAGGIFTFGSPGAPADFNPAESERCLICLSDYEKEAECRQLTKCKHVFHRECIDEWLTTGRNSCPLCRGEGVKEKNSTPETATNTSVPATATETGPTDTLAS